MERELIAERGWDPTLQLLKGHSDEVMAVHFHLTVLYLHQHHVTKQPGCGIHQQEFYTRRLKVTLIGSAQRRPHLMAPCLQIHQMTKLSSCRILRQEPNTPRLKSILCYRVYL